MNTCENDRFIAAAKAIEKGAYYTDPWDQNAYCRYCNCCQCHEEPTHDEECPVMVVAVTAHRMQHGLAAEAAA